MLVVVASGNVAAEQYQSLVGFEPLTLLSKVKRFVHMTKRGYFIMLSVSITIVTATNSTAMRTLQL